MKPPSPISETTFRVRYAETDQMGVVHHASYVVWLEEGRSNLIRSLGSSYAEFEKEGISLAVSELYVRYGQAAHYDQQVTVRCWLGDVKSRQLTFNYEVVEASSGVVLVTGYTRHVCINRQGQVCLIPARWRELLSGQQLQLE